MRDELQALGTALVGQFEVMREIGHGGMGVVALARDLRLDRLVAIKVLPAALSSDEARTRFLREARTAAQLSHPNIVPIYRADEASGVAFFVMGFVDGESLAERLQLRGALPAADVIPWLREVAWALAYAHARGVVHRDVKPENIMLERASGRAIVTDFGIARDVAADGLTATGHILGTVHYMSPEQSSGDPLDGRSDLYALGVVGFHLLSGRVPFEGLAPHAVIVANATRPAPPLCAVAPQVPHAVGAVIDRCLSKRPDDRYATGEQLADALAKALDDTQRDARAVEPATDAVMSEAAAEALWKRAAQLQSESLKRIDARRGSSTLPATTQHRRDARDGLPRGTREAGRRGSGDLGTVHRARAGGVATRRAWRATGRGVRQQPHRALLVVDAGHERQESVSKPSDSWRAGTRAPVAGHRVAPPAVEPGASRAAGRSSAGRRRARVRPARASVAHADHGDSGMAGYRVTRSRPSSCR